jgi:spoIIIJ-associated protein
MGEEIIKEAASVEEAVDEALDELGVQADAAEFEVLQQPGSSGPARVKVWVKPGYLAAEEPEAEEEEGEVPAELREHSAELPELSEEELDQVADAAVANVQGILSAFGIEATIDEYEGDEGEIILDIVGGELGILIGRHGRTLDALQTLAAAATSRKLGFRYPVVVDVEGYRSRRREKLEDIARRTADRVGRQGKAVKLRPMTSYERRVVHMVLRDDRRVTTASDGDEPFRAVVVSPN